MKMEDMADLKLELWKLKNILIKINFTLNILYQKNKNFFENKLKKINVLF